MRALELRGNKIVPDTKSPGILCWVLKPLLWEWGPSFSWWPLCSDLTMFIPAPVVPPEIYPVSMNIWKILTWSSCWKKITSSWWVVWNTDMQRAPPHQTSWGVRESFCSGCAAGRCSFGAGRRVQGVSSVGCQTPSAECPVLGLWWSRSNLQIRPIC